MSGQISIEGQGTVRLNIEYDEGLVHTLEIKDALYFPETIISILCAQHWYH